jgi:hypothetical protein
MPFTSEPAISYRERYAALRTMLDIHAPGVAEALATQMESMAESAQWRRGGAREAELFASVAADLRVRL